MNRVPCGFASWTQARVIAPLQRYSAPIVPALELLPGQRKRLVLLRKSGLPSAFECVRTAMRCSEEATDATATRRRAE